MAKQSCWFAARRKLLSFSPSYEHYNTSTFQNPHRIALPSRQFCHPERSAAESKDLTLCYSIQGTRFFVTSFLRMTVLSWRVQTMPKRQTHSYESVHTSEGPALRPHKRSYARSSHPYELTQIKTPTSPYDAICDFAQSLACIFIDDSTGHFKILLYIRICKLINYSFCLCRRESGRKREEGAVAKYKKRCSKSK